MKLNIDKLLSRDVNNNARELHIVLANRNKHKLGEIDNVTSINYHPQFNGSDEFSFTVYKTDSEGRECRLWEKIKQFKLIWVREYDEWFEITNEIDDSEKITKKPITATSLCEAELSQTKLRNIEINTEDDINRKEYNEDKPTVFYNTDPSISLLDRVLEKNPNYTIKHVDATLANIQRQFSFDGTTTYDALTSDIAQEIGCLFLFDTNERGIYVYDMEYACTDCGYRSEEEFSVCPKCGKIHINKPYGQDTSILIDKVNLGTGISLTCDTSSVKNCLHVKSSDGLIESTIRNMNPAGTTDYYYFSEDIIEDMSDELKAKYLAYQEDVETCISSANIPLENSVVNKYNSIVNSVLSLYPDQTFSIIPTTYVGFNNLTSGYYNATDLKLFLQSGMMPTWKQSDKTAETQLKLLTSSSLSPVALSSVNTNISKDTCDNAVLGMAKAIVDTGVYKVEITSSTVSGTTLPITWNGKFVLTSYSDDEDTASNTSDIKVTINSDYETYVNQKAEKAMARIDTDGIKDLSDIENDNDFKTELNKYCSARLESFKSAYQAAQEILIQQGEASTGSELSSLYNKYKTRYNYIESEYNERNNEISVVDSMLNELSNKINNIHSKYELVNYLGKDLYYEFISYRREDDYSNDNYISDDLSNDELVDLCNQLIETVKTELVKSGEKQYSISATLANLLLLTNEDGERVFEPILKDFTLGNFIRCRIDGVIYKMRLADVTIDYDSLDNLSVTFSDVSTVNSIVKSTMELIKNVSNISSSYSYTQRQAEKGNEAKSNIDEFRKDGLNASLTMVKNADTEDVVIGSNGITCRSYNDILQDYDPKQLKIIHNNLVYTTDNWDTAVMGLGEQNYVIDGVKYNGYGLNADFCISSTMVGGQLYSGNFSSKNKIGTYINLDNGNFSLAGSKIVYDATSNKLSLNNVTFDWNSSTNPEISNVNGLDTKLSGMTEATSKAQSTADGASSAASKAQTTADSAKGVADNAKTVGDNLVKVLGYDGTKITGTYIYSPVISGGSIMVGDKKGTYAQITTDGVLNCTGANITGKITSSEATITGGSLIVGDENGESYTEITSEGYLFAKKAIIHGEIYATSGEFDGKIVAKEGEATGDFTFGGFKSYKSSASNSRYLSTIDKSVGIGSNDKWGIWAGWDDSTQTAKFWVTPQGEVHVNGNWIYGGTKDYWCTWSKSVSYLDVNGTPTTANPNGWIEIRKYGDGYDVGKGQYYWTTLGGWTSDIKFKKDISDTDICGLNYINKIKHRQFTWIEGNRYQELGVVADEMKEICPTWVSEIGNGDDAFKIIQEKELIPYMTKAIQELSQQVNDLSSRIAELEK